ncbi:MAG: HAD-IC family P-type ATPase, partial [Cellulomonadaceae bacterium]
HDPDANATARALRSGVADVTPAQVSAAVPFSSARKWSAVATDTGAWVLGAPEMLLGARSDAAAERAGAEASRAAGSGARVVLLARCPGGLPAADAPVPDDVEPALVAVLGERVRPDAAQTLAYFRAQGVTAKVISGDSPETVAAIATAVGLRGDEPVAGYDARTLPEDPQALADVVAGHDVFGRVSPEQKRALVHALQARGHVVAMTGDGVNDALALKDADLGIAMGNGSAASKSVARIVLVDGRFATLPGVLAQGRRVMANMERVATLFLSKTTYSALLAVAVVLLAWPYPFLPRHMTLAGALTIGVPAFFLALPPNNRRYVPGFLRRSLAFAVPVGVVTALAVLAVFAYERAGTGDLAQARTGVTLVFIGMGLWVVGIIARPLRLWKVTLIGALALVALAAFTFAPVRRLFELEHPDGAVVLVAVGAAGCALVELCSRTLTPRLAAATKLS